MVYLSGIVCQFGVSLCSYATLGTTFYGAPTNNEEQSSLDEDCSPGTNVVVGFNGRELKKENMGEKTKKTKVDLII